MWRAFLIIILFVGSLNTLGNRSANALNTLQGTPFRISLPVVRMPPPPPIEVVVTARGFEMGYPTDYFVYGYVRNLTATALYSVTLEVDVTTYPYVLPGWPPEPPWTMPVRFTPALPATLPGQKNPFAYVLTLGKAGASFGDVRAVSTSATGPQGASYHSLSILNWTQAGSRLQGIVRNDSGRTLHAARVVVAELQSCGWRDAALDVTTVSAGQEATFHLDNYCQSDKILVVGQGIDRR